MGVKHPWLETYPINKGSERLIIGTHPPMPYKGEMKFFYGNMFEFWKLLSKVYINDSLFTNEKPDLEKIKIFLKKYKFSITDIVYRTEESRFSTDDEMKVLEFNPYLLNWLQNSNIKEIYFTSFSGKNGALPLFKKWLKENFGNKAKIKSIEKWDNYSTDIKIEDRTYKLIRLYSPSPTARKGIGRSIVFKNYLIDNPNSNADAFRIDLYKKLLPKIKS
jgi:G:T/U-mismatch repair DNA glycosylase